MSKRAGGGDESKEPLVGGPDGSEMRVTIDKDDLPDGKQVSGENKVDAKADEEEEREQAYSKLMDHLDGIKTRNRDWSKYYARAIKLVVFSLLVSGLVYSLTTEPTNRKKVLRLRIWRWVSMAIMITSIFSVVPALTWALSWPFMLAFRTHKYSVYYIREMRRSVDFTLWSCVVLFGWYVWFRPKVKALNNARYEDVVRVVCKQITRGLIALCIGFLLWSLKLALYLKLKADLHYDQLFDRIQHTTLFLNGIKALADKPENAALCDLLVYDKKASLDFSATCGNLSSGHRWRKRAEFVLRRKWENWTHKFTNKRLDKEGNIWMDVVKMERQSAPIWIIERLSKEYLRIVDSIEPPNPNQLINDDAQLLEKAEEMFGKITASHKKHMDQSDEITEDNLNQYKLSEEELAYLFCTKRDGDRKTRKENNQQYKPIKADRFLEWAVRAHKNCWGLKRTLNSSESAFVKLNRMLSTFLIVVVVIIWLLLSNIVSTAQLALLFAPFLAASFMFENSSKNLFQGIIFAFAMHPFDVGDRVIIEDIQMRVKELHILTSVFYKYDTGAEVIFPNSKLAITKIVNLDISPDQSDTLDFVISSKTPLENIKDLELTIKKLLDEDLYYAAGTRVVKNSCGSWECLQPELHMSVYLKYMVSYLTANKKAERKSQILTDIMRFCKEMESKQNMQEYPPEFKPYKLEFKLHELESSTKKKAIMLPGIESMKRKISKRLEKRGYKYHKVVITHLDDNNIKLALYVSNSSTGLKEQKQDDQEDGKNPKEPETVELKYNSKEDSQLELQLKRDNLFAGFASLLSEYGYDLKVVRDRDTNPTIYPQIAEEYASSSAGPKGDTPEITAGDRSYKT